jgi:hypothetical protein
MPSEIGSAGVSRTAWWNMAWHGNANSMRKCGNALLTVHAIDDAISPEHGKSWRELGIEDLALIVTDDHSDVGLRVMECLSQTTKRGTTGIITLLPDIHTNLPFQILLLSNDHQLIECPHPSFEMMLAIRFVSRNALPPL